MEVRKSAEVVARSRWKRAVAARQWFEIIKAAGRESSIVNPRYGDAATAAERLMLSRTRLYELRHQWLANKDTFALQPSGGDQTNLSWGISASSVTFNHSSTPMPVIASR